GRRRAGLQDRHERARRRPHRHRQPGHRHRPRRLRGHPGLREGAQGLRPAYRCLPDDPAQDRRHEVQAGRGHAADPACRLAQGPGPALHHRGLGGQADRLGGGDVDRPPGRADPCRHGLFQGNADRALFPRRQDHRDLRGHQRDPAAGDCPQRNRPALRPDWRPGPSPGVLRSPAEPGLRKPVHGWPGRGGQGYNSCLYPRPASTRSMNAPALATDDSIDAVVSALPKNLPAAERSRLERFARAFYRRLPQDEMAARPATEWAAVVASFLDFAGQREPGRPSISVLNPSLASDGFESTHTVVRIANEDMPFLVDSVRMALAQFGLSLHQIVHPVIQLRRDDAGRLVEVGEGEPESCMHLEVDRLADAGQMQALKDAILVALADVRAAVADWQPMRERMLEIAEALQGSGMPVDPAARAEARDFLLWCADNHFTFLGYREYEVR